MTGGAHGIATLGGEATTFADRLQTALESDASAREYLADADSTVAFRINSTGGEGVALRLSPGGVAVCPGAKADVTIEFSADQAGLFLRGRLPLGPSVLDGRVRATGELRSYLQVDPILQALLRGCVSGELGDSDRSTDPSGQVDATQRREILAIETEAVHKAFGSHRVLQGADLRIPEGTLSVVLGPSGTGKSVLIKHIIGALLPDQGDVRVHGMSLSGLSGRKLQEIRRDVGVMYQDGALFSSMSVYDNVAFSLREHTNIRESEIREIVLEHLKDVGLERARDLYPSQLSGGMRKRAGLARAVVLEPRILLCDEPDSGLDPVRTALLGELLLERHARHGGTIMVVTHNIPLARMIADHLSLLWKGQIVVSGSADTFFASDDPLLKQFLEGETRGPLGMD